ncbi:hypothetical protein [Rufibacter soli]
MWALVFFLLASVCKAFSDSIAHHKIRFGGYWWDGKQSWQAKWKDGDWTQGEAFPFSSTGLVFLTDGWHFFNMLQLWCYLFAAVAFYLSGPFFNWWVDVLLLHVAFTGCFQVFYRWVVSNR